MTVEEMINCLKTGLTTYSKEMYERNWETVDCDTVLISINDAIACKKEKLPKILELRDEISVTVYKAEEYSSENPASSSLVKFKFNNLYSDENFAKFVNNLKTINLGKSYGLSLE